MPAPLSTLTQPNCYGFALTGASVQVLPVNPSRTAVRFHNPNAANAIWVAPAFLQSGAANPATANGAGSFQIFPGGYFDLPITSGGPPPNCAWNASCPGNGNLSIIEFIT